MFGWFKNKEKKSKKETVLMDLSGQPLAAGDRVEALRYDLGECELIEINGHLHYRSIENQKEVVYVKMIDAITGNQKVNKL